MTLTVAAVARRLGVAPATLRTWDRRYGLGPSEHTAGAHRRYSATDLARLVVMRRLTLEGVAPAEAAAIASTTAVADGGFALASVATIPASVVQAAVTDAAAIAGPELAADPLAGVWDRDDLDRLASDRADAVERAAVEDAEARRAVTASPGSAGRAPVAPAAQDAAARVPAQQRPGVSPAAAARFTDAVRERGAARAWDEVLQPALAGGDEATAAAVASALHVGAVGTTARAVLLAGTTGEAGGLLLRAATAALAERDLPSRTAGAGVPARLLAAAVRRDAPPAVLLHASRRTAAGELDALLAVRPAPLVVLLGPGWPPVVPPSCVRAASLADAVARCAGAVLA
nr:MerR family transcriptional regulator [Kineococcus siccus]